LHQIVLFALLGALSASAYATWLWRLSLRGGRVQTGHLQLADFLVTSVIVIFFVLLSGLGFLAKGDEPAAPLTVQTMVLSLSVNLAIASGLAAFLAFRPGSIVAFLGLRSVSLPKVVLYALLFLVVAYPGLQMLALLTKSFAHVSDEQILVTLFRQEARDHDFRGTAAIFVAASVLAPLMEEFMFRGYVYGTLKRYGGAPAAAVFTSALFALIHVNLSSLPPLFFLALCLTIAYEWTGSLLVPITMHALFNTANLVGLYLTAQNP